MIRFFRVFVPASILALLASEFAILFSSYIAVAYLTMDVDPQVLLIYDTGLARILVNVVIIIAAFYFNHLYAEAYVRSKVVLIQRICIGFGTAFLGQALLGYLDPEWILPKWMMVEGSGLALVAVIGWRLLFGRASGMRTLGAQRILFVGSDPVVFEIASFLEAHPEMSASTVGYLAEQPVSGASMPYLGRPVEVVDVAALHKPTRISVCATARDRRSAFSELLDLRVTGSAIEEAEETYEAVFGRVCSRELRPRDLLVESAFHPDPRRTWVKDLVSYALATVAAILTLPVMLVLAVLVRIAFPGSAIVRTTCAGQNGARFTMLRFRSMHDGEAALLARGEGKSRISPLGRFLRRLNFDALPQLLNVLRGEMSLVGPRPERVEFAEVLAGWIPCYIQRHAVKPGIFGWSQINNGGGNGNADTLFTLEQDLYYVKNISTGFDLYILSQALRRVVAGDS